MDTAITDTTLLTMRGDGLGIITDGAIGFADGEIGYVGPAAGLDSESVARVIDGDGLVTLPGLVDAHVHMPLTILRGGAQDVPEIEWMRRALGPFSARMDDRDRIAGTRLGVLEALRGGATTIGEYAADVSTLVESVYRPLGVRVVATETINEVDDAAPTGEPRDPYPFDREKGNAALSRAIDLADEHADDPLISPLFGPQAVDMVSPDLLDATKEAAEERGVGIHMHVAQGRRERLQVEARYGTDASSVSVLADHGLLDASLLAAHLHGTTPSERERLVEAGVSMVGCPSSIAAIDGIVPPVAAYRELGGTVALGTDQAPGPGHHTMLRELRTAATLAKVDGSDPTALPAWAVLRLGTIEGARALGLADRIGSLEVGKRADVITVETDNLTVAPVVDEPLHTVVPNLVYSTTGAEVRDVFVDGDALVRQGDFVDADVTSAVETANERAVSLFDRGADDWRAAGSTLVDAVDEGAL